LAVTTVTALKTLIYFVTTTIARAVTTVTAWTSVTAADNGVVTDNALKSLAVTAVTAKKR
jgi:hypothetical protein